MGNKELLDSLKDLKKEFEKEFDKYPHMTVPNATSPNQQIIIDVTGYCFNHNHIEGSPALYGDISKKLGYSISEMNRALNSSGFAPFKLNILKIVDETPAKSTELSQLYLAKENLDKVPTYLELMKKYVKIGKMLAG